MSIRRQFLSRTFVETEFFQPQERLIAGKTSNNVWLYTVERGTELECHTGNQSRRPMVKIIRWRARNRSHNKKIWQYYRSYNVRSTDEWENISNCVDILIAGNVQDQIFIPITIPIREYNRLSENFDKLKLETSERRRLLSKITSLRKIDSAREAERQSFKKRLSLMRSNVRKFETVLRDFKKTISNPDTTETQVHKFLVDHDAFWMFGLEYIGIQPKVKFPPHGNYYEFDLMLQRHDGFWDLVELKGPNENLFDKRTSKRNKPNQKLSEAVGQVFTYLFAIDKTWNPDIVKPQAYIIIGNKETDLPSQRRIFASYLSNVNLITYRELYERGKQLLKYVKNGFPKLNVSEQI